MKKHSGKVIVSDRLPKRKRVRTLLFELRSLDGGPTMLDTCILFDPNSRKNTLEFSLRSKELILEVKRSSPMATILTTRPITWQDRLILCELSFGKVFAEKNAPATHRATLRIGRGPEVSRQNNLVETDLTIPAEADWTMRIDFNPPERKQIDYNSIAGTCIGSWSIQWSEHLDKTLTATGGNLQATVAPQMARDYIMGKKLHWARSSRP